MSSFEAIKSFHKRLSKPPIQEIHEPLFIEKQLKIYILRTDLIHPTIKGNKWFKLHYNLLEALQRRYDTLLTFGGAYSNHIYATAAAGQLFGLKTIGIIRGEEYLPLNPILSFARQSGMKLHYMSRQNYRQKHTDLILKELQQTFSSFYLIPEGGANLLGIRGCLDILPPSSFDYICCACGTGGTLAGLIASAPPDSITLGFPVLKGGDFLYSDVNDYLAQFQQNYPEINSKKLKSNLHNWSLITDYHFGGYAKKNKELLGFIADFQTHHSIPIEPVYTGKLFYGIYQKIREDYFKPNSTILIIHSGGVY